MHKYENGISITRQNSNIDLKKPALYSKQANKFLDKLDVDAENKIGKISSSF